MAYGKSINLFLVNGQPDSLIIATLSNWDAKAVRIPRIEVSGCTRPEIQMQGVYFLLCENQETGEKEVYVGEADEVHRRLKEHIMAHNADKEKYYWHTAICFTSQSLNKTLVRYLENRSVEEAKKSNRYVVLTQQTYSNTVISENDKASMDEFFDNMKIVLGTLGCEALEPLDSGSQELQNADKRFGISIGRVKAEGELTADGFVVYKGAILNEKTNERSLGENMAKRREALIASEKISDYITQEDILFTSPSAAADTLLGYSVSGPATWKDKNGVAIKDRDDI